MPPEKHGAGPVTEIAPPAKMSKAANDFPLFNDGDVDICVGSLAMKLHSRTLRDNCNYFANFDKLPTRFMLMPSTDTSITSYMVVPASSDGSGGEPDTPAPRSGNPKVAAVAANETVFRLLYHKPISCTTVASFYHVTALAVEYGCINAIQDGLITALLRASLGTQMFRNDPDLLLYTGYHLREKGIFTEALVRTVGQYKCDNGYIPESVKGLVAKGVDELKEKVRQCWGAAIRCCEADGISGVVAATLLRKYLDKCIPCILGSPLHTKVYNVLVAIHRMDDAKPLLEVNLITQMDTINDGLDTGMTYLRDVVNEPDEGYRSEMKWHITQGLDCGVSGGEVVKELEKMLEKVQNSIKSLFTGDRNVGYFTCFQFEGPFPWESLTDSSGNGAHL